MRFARFSFGDEVHEGIVGGDSVSLIEGSMLGDYRVTSKSVSVEEVSFLPPTTPSKVVCVAHNFSELIAQIEEEFPEIPVFFLKPPSSLIGPGRPIVYPSDARRVIYEGELAVIVKKTMRNVPREHALDHVLGYCCFNDVTERQIIEDSQLYLSLGKGYDTFGPVGPYVETDADPSDLEIRTYVNGEITQRDSTKNFIFPVDFLLHWLSTVMTLNPGDVIPTGTPGGVDSIVPGDEVAVEIDGLGRIENPVVSAGP